MQQQYQCPQCGAPVSFGSRFCSNCAFQLDWTIQQQSPPPQNQPPQYQLPQQPAEAIEDKPTNRRLRIAAGILMIIVGIMELSTPGMVASALNPTPTAMVKASSSIVYSSLFLLVLIVGGGILALIKKIWWWAFLGAICSVFVGVVHGIATLSIFPTTNFAFALGLAGVSILFTSMGMLALILLIKSKGQFQ